MSKVRVYELAKELGLESKQVLEKLNDIGEFARSASSTVEAPVARKLRESLGASQAPASAAPRRASSGSSVRRAPTPSRAPRPAAADHRAAAPSSAAAPRGPTATTTTCTATSAASIP